VERKVTVTAREATLEQILDELFRGEPVSYEFANEALIVLTRSDNPLGSINSYLQENMQQPAVSGTVTDEAGQPLPGVTVIVKGTTQGTVTNADGNYSITNIPEGATLVFSFVGMRTQEMVIGNQTNINIRLEQETIGLEEVVAVGYGTQKKVNLTGAVDVISNEKLSNRQVSSVSQMLQGLSAGFNFDIDENGFQPGATMDISIRGLGSLNGGEPYIIIDGFPGNLNNLNPEDIESISVLKDAAASAIYGARAPYGVILITTKKGNKNEKLTATYTGNLMVNTPQKLPEMLDSYTWARIQNEAARNRGGRPFSDQTVDLIIAYQNEDWGLIRSSIPNWPDEATIFGAYPVGNTWNNANLNYANTDWYDEYYGYSINQKHDFSLKGGSQNASYYFSAGYLDQNGVLNYGTDNYQRLNILGKMHLSIADWWDIHFETRLNRSLRIRPNMTKQGDYSRIFHDIAKMYPITPLYDGFGYYHTSSGVPWIENGSDDIKETDQWQTINTEIRPVKNWKINADFGFNTYSQFRSDVEKYGPVHNLDGTVTPHGTTVPNNIEQFHSDNTYWTTNVYTSYDWDINDKHNVYLLAGFQLEKGNQNQMVGYKTDLIVEDIPSLQTATGDPLLSESLTHSATQGYFSRLNYNYKEKYLIEANARYDGSYVFRETKRWGFFPSFSLGWNIHKETFWNSFENYINTFKLRGSWGQLGNQNVSPYSDIALIPLQTGLLNWIFNYGEARPAGYTSAPNLINRNLTWETSTTKNLGINMSFLNNRLQTDFDIFERLTTDMVGPSEAKPGVLGANVPRANNSTLQTRGWEVALRWKQDLSNSFSYFINLNLYDNKSVITKYHNPTGTLSTWYEGKEVGEIWGYQVNDLFRSQEEVDTYLADVDMSFLGSRWNPGDLRFEDLNNDGEVNNGSNTIDDHGDISIVGNNSPRYQYGITAGFNFKGFDFSMLWKGTAKRDLYFSYAANTFWGFSGWWFRSSLLERNLDYFRDEPGTKYIGLYEGEANINTDAYWPRPYLNAGEMRKNLSNPNTRYMQSGAYIRMQNVQLGYTLPNNLVSRLSLQKLRFFLSGENLLTFKKLPDNIDPVATYGYVELGSGDEGIGRTYGPDRIYSFGVTITY